ncbi:16S rRNA (cytosine(1402)-N(4))-methyltransferase RsmH [Corynebacterium sp. 320]|uniref:16S rRNA (cytosine(1402)-N(4))-methyltransferase RsmH n=1 Tax=Corynebacterium TaxID=1716 RepID=UPI00125CCCA6|nr:MULTISPECIES: 16S rRNA (cytosine(1402)-N(4))-methyltransferase RsmH [Corynebacterium]KAB1502496.1 16S rRNA (cytosine(1402)-N(4))-methyltransferase RsmH [Corynebacterium sp. 320]KAB1551283.1 16S rRNA (cytosine(1402)-N(4))-methyltransferase RsmH [Corynebacterium sp. 321]KAB1551889.1 16S rRNA (cytosine(1402)-N(4))-methyltransferase RsmH [Corynebacterium sp. 319]KAB3526103.1 16S rRNA (cytosine(1402)-N(4))-methyltransferase RsmH [Corynebacterium sp. 250]KAB3538883.1 16S rRNA (cytosine(1402)-N(4)
MAPQRQDPHHGHVPVMRDRMVELVGHGVRAASAPESPVIIDGTLGSGGHSEAFLTAFPDAIVVGLDRDPHALAEARERLEPFGDRFCSYHTRFDNVSEALHGLVDAGQLSEQVLHTGVSGFLYDLGVSSMQLDQAPRGFSYSVDSPLDMRMDPQISLTAAEILNTYSHGDLARILKTYGDERFAGKIASAVLREREKEPFTHSGRLVELLYATIPAASRRSGGHPAKRTFQALRIEVNAELEAIEHAIPNATGWLHTGGVGVFMSYQSLEDKLVKKGLKDLTTSRSPAGLPMELPGTEAPFEFLTRGAEKASEEEIVRNSRAAPVRVRAVRRISDGGHTTFPIDDSNAHT